VYAASLSFEERLAMSDAADNEPIPSPYTGAVLPPFIYHDTDVRPRRVLLHAELLARVAGRAHCAGAVPPASPPCAIDYSHLRARHVDQVSRLLSAQFWPGIDSAPAHHSVCGPGTDGCGGGTVSECLHYPDYSVVALHRRLVVGCAFVTPMGYVTHIATHPEWRGLGLGAMMLFLLLKARCGVGTRHGGAVILT
jgi:hypothetical protein